QGDLRPEMVEALKRIKAQFKTGCITNNLPANAIGSLTGRTLYVAEVMALFDHVIESAKIGLRKPDPRIYRMMVETLKVDPRDRDGHVLLQRTNYSAAAAIRSGNAAASDARSGFRTPRSVMRPVTRRAGVTSKA